MSWKLSRVCGFVCTKIKHKVGWSPLFLLLLVYSFSTPPASAAEKKGSEPDLYVRLPNFLVSVIQHRQIKAAYSLSLVIELTSPKHAEAISLLKPRIVDAILVDLHGVFSIIWEPYVHINLADLKKRLVRIVKKTAGDFSVKDVLIQELQSQLKN